MMREIQRNNKGEIKTTTRKFGLKWTGELCLK